MSESGQEDTDTAESVSCGIVKDGVSRSHAVNQYTLPFKSLVLVICLFYVLSLHKSFIYRKCSKNSIIVKYLYSFA